MAQLNYSAFVSPRAAFMRLGLLSRILTKSKQYVIGPYQTQNFSKKVGTEVRGRTTKSPQGIQTSHLWLLGASETLCAPHISAYTVQ